MALPVGSGLLTGGIEANNAAPPRAFVEALAHLKPNLGLYAEGDYAGPGDWNTSAGFLWRF